jgi:putative oxidoreductase
MLDFFVGVYFQALGVLSRLRDLPPLIFRLLLGYGFYGPAIEKYKYPAGTIKFFTSLGIPMPELNYYMAMSTELAGTVCVTLGLATRLISVPMSVVMLVAISTAHWAAGFQACQCNADGGPKYGYEIPVYFLCMLLFLIINGPGRISLDHLIKNGIANRGKGGDKSGWHNVRVG